MHPNEMRTLLLCFLTYFTCFCEAEGAPGYKITDWRRCPDPMTRYLAISQLSLEKCVNECKIRPICKALAYRRLCRLCEIYSSESNIILNSTARFSCVFVERKDIKQDNLSCNCSDRYVCNISDGQCSIRECSPYVKADVIVHGNRNKVMSKIELSCHPIWKLSNLISICNADGTWGGNLECPHLKCPEGNEWVEQENSMPGFILQFNLIKMNHSSARQNCEDVGSRLVIINSVEKREYISRICTLCGGHRTYFWTDGSSVNNEMWFSDGTRMPLGNMNWVPGRPDVSDLEGKCARLQFNYEYRWRDAHCVEEFFYICEK